MRAFQGGAEALRKNLGRKIPEKALSEMFDLINKDKGVGTGPTHPRPEPQPEPMAPAGTESVHDGVSPEESGRSPSLDGRSPSLGDLSPIPGCVSPTLGAGSSNDDLGLLPPAVEGLVEKKDDVLFLDAAQAVLKCMQAKLGVNEGTLLIREAEYYLHRALVLYGHNVISAAPRMRRFRFRFDICSNFLEAVQV